MLNPGSKTTPDQEEDPWDGDPTVTVSLDVAVPAGRAESFTLSVTVNVPLAEKECVTTDPDAADPSPKPHEKV